MTMAFTPSAKKMKHALLLFRKSVESSLPMRGLEFYEDTMIEEVTLQEKARILNDFMTMTMTQASPGEEISAASLKELSSGIDETIEQFRKRNEDTRKKAVSLMDSLIDTICLFYETSLKSVDPHNTESWAREKICQIAKLEADKMFENSWKLGDEKFQEEQKEKLEIRLLEIKCDIQDDPFGCLYDSSPVPVEDLEDTEMPVFYKPTTHPSPNELELKDDRYEAVQVGSGKDRPQEKQIPEVGMNCNFVQVQIEDEKTVEPLDNLEDTEMPTPDELVIASPSSDGLEFEDDSNKTLKVGSKKDGQIPELGMTRDIIQTLTELNRMNDGTEASVEVGQVNENETPAIAIETDGDRNKRPNLGSEKVGSQKKQLAESGMTRDLLAGRIEDNPMKGASEVTNATSEGLHQNEPETPAISVEMEVPIENALEVEDQGNRERGTVDPTASDLALIRSETENADENAKIGYPLVPVSSTLCNGTFSNQQTSEEGTLENTGEMAPLSPSIQEGHKALAVENGVKQTQIRKKKKLTPVMVEKSKEHWDKYRITGTVVYPTYTEFLGWGHPMFQCNSCKKKFKSRNCIKNHELCGKRDKPYKCDSCTEGFTNKQKYEIHIRSHPGLKPFTCTECNRRFNTSMKLSAHSYIHTGRYACHKCGKRFSGKTNLFRHLLTHAGMRPFKCSICEVHTRRRDYLIRHVKHKHQQSKEVAKELADAAATEYFLREIQALPTPSNPNSHHLMTINTAIIVSILKNAGLLPNMSEAGTSGQKSTRAPSSTSHSIQTATENPANALSLNVDDDIQVAMEKIMSIFKVIKNEPETEENSTTTEATEMG